MLVFDESSHSIAKQEYYAPGATDGYWQGNLIHLPIGNGSGYLISLMAASRTANLSWTDADGDSGNSEDANGVSLEYIPIYDIDRDIWFKQRTTFVGWDQKPEPRTRFCSALFHNAMNNTFELWMHGGQRLTNQAEGVTEIYVLSMPSFTWTQVNTAFPSNNLIRSHTCHAVGGQLVIVGGYPPGIVVESNVTCDPDYIKVLAIGEEDINWTPNYRTDSTYRTPLSISNIVRGNRVPLYGFVNEQLGNAFEPQCPGGASCPGTSGGLTVGAIAGCAIAGIVVILASGWLLWYCRNRQRPAGTRNNSQNAEHDPRSPANGQPEVVKTGNALPASHQRTTSQVTEVHRADAELPAEPPSRAQTQHTV